jgi:hypothetical protein
MGYDQEPSDPSLESLLSKMDQLNLEYESKRKEAEIQYTKIAQLKLDEMEATKRFDTVAKEYKQIHESYVEATQTLRTASEMSRQAFERWQLNHSSIMATDIELRKTAEELKQKKRDEKRALKLRFSQLSKSGR